MVAWGALAVAPALAAAADRPAATTGPVTNVTPTSATLTGTVNPNGDATQYVFLYGATRYDTHSAVASAGAGTAPVAVSVPITGLAQATTYHVRLIALNSHGFDVGHDALFATQSATGAPTPVNPMPTVTPPSPLLNSAPSSEAPPPPVLGQTVNVGERSGSVMVKAPGVPTFVPLSQLASVPVGSIVDTRKGTVTLKTALPSGDIQSATFHGGLFEVRQPKGTKGLTEVRMRGALPTCGSGSARAAALDKKKKKRRPPRRLWGRDNNGLFRTRGGNSVATVRGTSWFVEDRCDGTLTRVSVGSVTVRDLVAHRTVVVRAGHSYLARRTG
jgi:hypothetical protein